MAVIDWRTFPAKEYLYFQKKINLPPKVTWYMLVSSLIYRLDQIEVFIGPGKVLGYLGRGNTITPWENGQVKKNQSLHKTKKRKKKR